MRTTDAYQRWVRQREVALRWKISPRTRTPSPCSPEGGGTAAAGRFQDEIVPIDAPTDHRQRSVVTVEDDEASARHFPSLGPPSRVPRRRDGDGENSSR